MPIDDEPMFEIVEDYELSAELVDDKNENDEDDEDNDAEESER